MTTRTSRAARSAAVLLLALATILAAGCSRDLTAPPPTNVTPTGAAQIAGAMGWLLPRMGGQFLQDPATGDAADKSLLTFVGDVQGSCRLNFRNGAGAEVPWNQAAQATLVTNGGPLAFHGGSVGLGGEWSLAFDLKAAVDQTTHVATVDGSGSLVTSGGSNPYTISALGVPATAFPTTGTISVTVGTVKATVAYSEGSTATVTAGGHTYSLDLDTGTMAQMS